MFVAGIDGGGTHTRVELRDMGNQPIRRGEFGPFNINSIGEDAFKSLMGEVFSWCGDMEQCAALCIGGAGVSNPMVKVLIQQELDQRNFRGKWYLCGDQEIALRGAMDGAGVVVIAGTGSICFGKNSAGETARSGGFGHLIDDGGSGYALGRDVFACAVRSLDGRVPDHGMLQAVCDCLGGGPEKIVPFVYGPETDKAAIARFASIALEQAEQGNPEALDILERGAGELAQLISAVQQRLGLAQCRIALLGGLLEHDNCYRKIAVDQLSRMGTVVSAAHNALWGAAQMAWEL